MICQATRDYIHNFDAQNSQTSCVSGQKYEYDVKIIVDKGTRAVQFVVNGSCGFHAMTEQEFLNGFQKVSV